MEIGVFVLALVPIVLLMMLLGVWKVAAHKAAPITLLVTIVLALSVWKMPLRDSLGAVAEGATMGLWPIMIVIVAAIFSYNLAQKSGSMDKITTILESISTDQRIQVLILAWGFGGFLEAVAGYGTAVAIPASILAALGFNPLFAAVVSLIANTVPTAFGAIGIPVSTLAELTNLDPLLLSGVVALQLTPFILIIPFVLVMMTGGGFKALKGVWGITLASGIGFAVPHYFAARYLGPQFPALFGAMGSLMVTIFLAQRRNPSKEQSFTLLYHWQAWRPYVLILLFILLASPMVPLVYHFLAQFHSSISFVEGQKAYVIKWITTPGALIFLATVVTGYISGLRTQSIAKIFLDTVKQLGKSFPTVLAIVAMAKVMSYSGMITDLATTLASLTGPVYPFISPAIGTLGTFVTGSDTSSNVLFGELQQTIATSLAIDPYWLTAANTAGATMGKMISPQSIAVATSATGQSGSEGEILAQTLRYCLVFVVIMGIGVGCVALFL